MKFYIMSGNTKVAKCDEKFNIEVLNEKLLPLYIKTYKDPEKWIRQRAIDGSRTNARFVKHEHGLSRLADDLETALKYNAATITDNYWIKPLKSELCWEDIEFTKNESFATALDRQVSKKELVNSPSPELTNIGSQEKGWKKDDEGTWWLYKHQTPYENYAEYLTYRIGELFGFNMAIYEICDDEHIKTKDFTEGYLNLEHANSLVFDHKENGEKIIDEDYKYNYETFCGISKEAAQDYLNILFLDAVCQNVDRHTKNYGVLRDQQSGKIVSMAPNYDNNFAFFTNTKLTVQRKNDRLLQNFIQFIKENEIEFCVPDIDKTSIEKVCAAVLANTDIDATFMSEYIYSGYTEIKTEK